MIAAMTGRRLVVAALACLAGTAGCHETAVPIAVHSDRVVLANLTDDAWRDIELTINRYYRAKFEQLAPGGRIDAPLRRFQGGFGRYFDVQRERVTEVHVTASTGPGAPVELSWRAADTPSKR